MNNDYQKIDASASLIAKEKFGITKQKNKHFITEANTNEVYMIGFGNGPKTDTNPKGFYAYWVSYHKEEPIGALINCELKDKYDSIDYFMSCIENAEATIRQLHEKTD